MNAGRGRSDTGRSGRAIVFGDVLRRRFAGISRNFDTCATREDRDAPSQGAVI